jgi:DNA-binding transcriptional LysR family regulator
MIRLDDLALFVRAAALGSFSHAAREVDLLPGQVSAAIKRLEAELGIRLFARSTRSLRLTAEGVAYLPHAQSALDALRAGAESVQPSGTALHGTLQVAAPSDVGRNVLLPWLSEFRRDHPDLTVRLFLSDQIADVFRDPVDIALRYGQIGDASFVALPLAPDNRRVLVAAPAYLARRGRPREPGELARHDCLLYMLHGRVYDKWVFPLDGDEKLVVPVSGPLLCDDAEVVRRWAVAGEGIAYKSWLDVCDDVEAGRLEILLPDVACEPTPLQLICPHRKQFSPAVRLLHEALLARCAPLAARRPGAAAAAGATGAAVATKEAAPS